ncbi:P-loop containing nucleoside triphosphate hydrolase protein [Xylariomycetidae sp. FL2044]|nr:P-loop containing nucleoside triphosphate hydrolase protein [Xylariomycetidae sp. FL2044]
MAAPGDKPQAAEEPVKDKRILSVDQVWSKGDRQWHYVKTSNTGPQDRFSKYAIVLRRIINEKGQLAEEKVDIRSPKLAEFLKTVFTDVSNMGINQKPPTLRPRELFHAHSNIVEKLAEEQAKDEKDTSFIDDLLAAVTFLDDEFGSTIKSLESLLQKDEITYDLLWAIFPPHEELFEDENTLKEYQVSKLEHGTYEENWKGERYYQVRNSILHHDGDIFGWGPIFTKIPHFDGSQKISSLPIHPLRFHPKREDIRSRVLERGRKYVSLLQPTCMEYEGLGAYSELVVDQREYRRFGATGRIMVDPFSFRYQQPRDLLLLRPVVMRSAELAKLTDDELIMCNHRMLGFSLTAKRWGGFAVSKMAGVEWDENAYKKLIVDEKKRHVICSLVKSHRKDETSFDDVIVGKGKGLVGLLSGSPGVGKTLTAEVVSELSQRPLYQVSAGELGTEIDKVDKQLSMVFHVTQRWGCVLLIDEADVFLFKRGDGSLERNALVSIFLRRLEYFQGIVIMTTNRRQDIDEAFDSRIHFKFHYEELKEEDRFQVWKNFLNALTKETGGVKLSDEDLRSLSKEPLNGREIKNAVSCALAIARANQEPLTGPVIKDTLVFLMDKDTTGSAKE